MSFLKELKRRNVYKVGIAYLIVAWLIVQAAAIVFPHLNLPTWAVTLVIVILIIGLPIALLLALAYEVTPEGIKRTKEVPLAESITHLTGQKLNYIVTGLLVVAVAALVVDNYLLDKDAVEPEVVSTETKQAPTVSEAVKAKKTIAVIPFVNRSSEKDQEYFVEGLSDEIITILSQISDLQVTSSTSSFTFKGSDKTIQEIAEKLGVAYILEGSVRKVGNALRITAQLIRAADDYHLWSEIYDRELKDIFAVQEDIATAVADELKVALGIDKSLKQLGGTDNVEAYQLYLIAKGQSQAGEVNLALKSIDEAIKIDPEFALAWAQKALAHLDIAVIGIIDNASLEQSTAQSAVQRAIEIEPNLAIAHAVVGVYRTIKGDFIAAESAYRKALELKTDQSWDEMAVGVHYFAVGYLDRGGEILETALRNDPLNLSLRTMYIGNLVCRGDRQKAEEEYERFKVLFGNQPSVDIYISLLRLETGAGDILSPDNIPFSDPIFDILKKHLGSPKEALRELREIYNNEKNLSIINMFEISNVSAYLGDPEFAMEVAEKTIHYDHINMLWFWYTGMREVRQLPRFKEFVKETGLIDYWNEFGWPDLCQPTDDGDFECD